MRAFLAVALLALAPSAQAVDQPLLGALGPGAAVPVALEKLPGALAAGDIERYRKIFALQEAGNWHDAEHEIGQLGDTSLMGHVLAQKFLHPTKYRSKFTELRVWLGKYADHPQARRIYKLALTRKPRKSRVPRAPVAHGGRGNPLAAVDTYEPKPLPRKRLTRAQRRRARSITAQVRSRARRGWPTGAAEILGGKEAVRLFSTAEYDALATDIAAGYYFAGKDDKALEIARRAMRSGQLVPLAHWWGGLAAWRLGNMAAALDHFGALAKSDNATGWDIAAGAFWAARASFVARRPQEVNGWLAIGATRPRTFYGLLSRRALALDLEFDWTLPALGVEDAREVTATALGGRAVALLQVGREADAEAELRNLARSQPKLIGTLLALASHHNMPGLTLRLAWATQAPAPAALYPTTAWVPEERDGVDRALVHAIIRQESAFNTRAKSRAGARGLMQLMPRTASYVGRQRSLRGSRRDRLYDPALNVNLGLKYVSQLLNSKIVGQDLFRLTVAYNAGPGNLRKWERRVDYRDDALLFIESLPSRETRQFIEHVLANLWIYRHRMNQPTPTLDAIVAGDWPRYVGLDRPTRAAEKHVAN